MSSRLYSRSRRSCTISECSSPRKPHRKPKPIADETCNTQCLVHVTKHLAAPVSWTASSMHKGGQTAQRQLWPRMHQPISNG